MYIHINIYIYVFIYLVFSCGELGPPSISMHSCTTAHPPLSTRARVNVEHIHAQRKFSIILVPSFSSRLMSCSNPLLCFFFCESQVCCCHPQSVLVSSTDHCMSPHTQRLRWRDGGTDVVTTGRFFRFHFRCDVALLILLATFFWFRQCPRDFAAPARKRSFRSQQCQ